MGQGLIPAQEKRKKERKGKKKKKKKKKKNYVYPGYQLSMHRRLDLMMESTGRIHELQVQDMLLYQWARKSRRTV